jgi:hypothetical protein
MICRIASPICLASKGFGLLEEAAAEAVKMVGCEPCGSEEIGLDASICGVQDVEGFGHRPSRGAEYALGCGLGDAVSDEHVRDLGCALWSVRRGGELVVI